MDFRRASPNTLWDHRSCSARALIVLKPYDPKPPKQKTLELTEAFHPKPKKTLEVASEGYSLGVPLLRPSAPRRLMILVLARVSNFEFCVKATCLLG